MTIHMKINEEGFPIAFYDSILWPELPENTIEITEKQHLELLENQGLRVWNSETKRINKYEPPGPSDEELLAALRNERDRLLKDSDWVSLRALDTGESVPKKWVEYRQALRDMPVTTSNLKKPDWPIKPEN